MQTDYYKCHIQEMCADKGTCIVFIEELGEKRWVAYNSLKPFNVANQSEKKMMLPYRTNNRSACDGDDNDFVDKFEYGKRKACHYDKLFNKQRKSIDKLVDSFNYTKYIGPKQFCDAIDLKEYINLSNFRPQSSNEIIAMPMVYSNSSAANMNGNNSSAGNSNGNNNSDRKGIKSRGNHQNSHVASQQLQQQHQDNKQQVQAQLSKIHEDNEFNSKNVHDPNQELQSNQLHNQGQHHQPEPPIDTNVPVQQQQNHPLSTQFYHAAANPADPYYQPYNESYVNYVSTEVMQPTSAANVYAMPGVYPATSLPVNSFAINPMYQVPVPGCWQQYNAPINPTGLCLIIK